MLTLDYTFDDASCNLALEEVLLKHATTTGEEVLRFWESPSLFVVLGLTQKVQLEVSVEHCREDGVPIRRRCSAGGCVVQGPGCLNYTLVLSKDRHPDIPSIQGSYTYIFDKIIEQLDIEGLAKMGISDLAMGELKVSGNAQRRQKEYILHHGTLLYKADLVLFSHYIQEPQDRPDYRGKRDHTAFIRNLPLTREVLVEAICKAFDTNLPSTDLLDTHLQESRLLADSKYDSDEWIYRK